MTPAEILFVMKAWEDKTVRDTTYIRDAVYNAMLNANRKKRQRFLKLWRKSGKLSVSKAEDYKDKISSITEIEKHEGKSWIDKVLAGAGIKQRKTKKRADKNESKRNK